MINYLIGRNHLRRTRFHDEKGNFVGWRRATLHAPPALVSAVLRVALDYRPSKPWISYDAIDYLSGFLNKTSRVLEFGSGMSTIWYAQHAAMVCSVEGFEPWHARVKDMLKSRGYSNVRCEYATTRDGYVHAMDDEDEDFDLIMVDGAFRLDCLRHSCKRLRTGGVLYLDNADKESHGERGEMRQAEQFALEFAAQQRATVTYLTDFAPTQFFVQQGLMVHLPCQPSHGLAEGSRR